MDYLETIGLQPFIVPFNFDRAATKRYTQCGIKGVSRNKARKFILGFSKNCDGSSNNIAELLALKKCIKIAREHELKNIVFEGDSMIAINVTNRKLKPRWRLRTIVDNICYMLKKIENWTI